MKPTRTCSIDGCERPVVAWGWCDPHYRRWRRHGDPTGGITYYSSPEEAFAAKTEWRGECLEWTGSRMRNGYGTTTVNRGSVLAHRYAWERANGPIPEGMEIDHICHNRACANVEHLRLVTSAQNSFNRGGPLDRSISGIRNVRKNHKGWQVSLQKNGQWFGFGTYPTIEEAAEVAERARKELFGEFAGRG